MFRSWQNETFHLLENTPRHFFVKDVGALSSMVIPLSRIPKPHVTP